MNKVWEIIEKELGSKEDHTGYRSGTSHTGHMGYKRGASFRQSESEIDEAYQCGFEKGFTEALKKVIHIIKSTE